MRCKTSGRSMMMLWLPSRQLLHCRARLTRLLSNLGLSGNARQLIADLATATLVRFSLRTRGDDSLPFVRGTIEDYVRDVHRVLLERADE